MAEIRSAPGGGVGPLRLLADAVSTSEGAGTFELENPVRHFSLQVEGTTDAVITLQGALSTAATLQTILTWSSDTVGSILSTESTGPFSYITASFDGGASSGTPTSAWVSATP